MAVLVGLAVLWAIVLLPDVVRRASVKKSYDTIGSFKNHLSVLERANPVHSSVPGIPERPSNVVPLVPRSTPPQGNLHLAPIESRRPAQPVRAVPAQPPRGRQASGRAAAGVHPRRPAPAPATRPAVRSNRVSGAEVAHRRRQDIITGLFAASLLSFLAFLSFGGPMLMVHVIIDVLLVAYVGLVLLMTRREREAPATPSYRPAAYVERTAPVYAAASGARRSATR